jgi:hypothetical protein
MTAEKIGTNFVLAGVPIMVWAGFVMVSPQRTAAAMLALGVLLVAGGLSIHFATWASKP